MNPTEKNNINPNFSGVTTGGQYAQMNNPAPIAVSGLSEPVKPFQPPQATPTDYSNVAQTASAVAQIPTQTSAPTDSTGFLKAIQETSSKLGVQPDVPSLVQQYKDLTGIDTAQLPAERQQAQAKVQELTAKLAMLDAKSLKNQEAAMKRGETMGFASREAQNIARTDAIERLATSSELNAYQGRLDTAKQNVTDILNLQSKDLENKKQQQDTLFNNAKDIASADQQVALEKSRQEASRKLAQENDFANLRQSLATELIKNGDIQGAMKVAKSNSMNELSLNAPSVTQNVQEFSNVIDLASGLVPATKQATTRNNLIKSLATKNYVDAYAQLASSVSDGLTGENKTKFDSSLTDLNVMNGLEKAIKDYTDAGGKLGYLKGTADEIAKNFGQLATDPKFAILGTQLQREFQTYRLNMTGAAFSPAESREYAKVNPRTNASLDLNLATIQGAKNQLANRIQSTVNARIPDAQKIYNLAFQNEQNTQQKQVTDINSAFEEWKKLKGIQTPATTTTQTKSSPTFSPEFQNAVSSFNLNSFLK